jgi:hypothetical protein
MDTCTWYICTVEYYLRNKKNEVLIQTITWMKLKNIMLSKERQEQKLEYCMIPFV